MVVLLTGFQRMSVLALAVLLALAALKSAVDKARGKPVREFPAYASAIVAVVLFAYLLTSNGGA
jgi:hypothetical protein